MGNKLKPGFKQPTYIIRAVIDPAHLQHAGKNWETTRIYSFTVTVLGHGDVQPFIISDTYAGLLEFH